MPGAYTFEEIPPFRLCVSREHRFGTDAFLLAGFSRPRQGEKVCDLCSGCGIIPLLWLRRERRPWVAYGVELLEQAVEAVFDLRPSAIIERLDLRRPIYRKIAAYGHFGRPELDLPWEKTDMVEAVKAAL